MAANKAQELANCISHATGIAGSLFALGIGLYTLASVQASLRDYAAVWVYGLCSLALYTASTVYHALFRKPKAQRIARRFDHAAIYLMIAGSYTPFLWIALGDSGNLWSLAIWTIAFIGIAFKTVFAGRFQWFSTCCYLGMGWLSVLLWPELRAVVPVEGLHLLLAGGMLYSVGSIFYMWKRLPFQHFIWHLFVLGGSLTQWLCIQLYVIARVPV